MPSVSVMRIGFIVSLFALALATNAWSMENNRVDQRGVAILRIDSPQEWEQIVSHPVWEHLAFTFMLEDQQRSDGITWDELRFDAVVDVLDDVETFELLAYFDEDSLATGAFLLEFRREDDAEGFRDSLTDVVEIVSESTDSGRISSEFSEWLERAHVDVSKNSVVVSLGGLTVADFDALLSELTTGRVFETNRSMLAEHYDRTTDDLVLGEWYVDCSRLQQAMSVSQRSFGLSEFRGCSGVIIGLDNEVRCHATMTHTRPRKRVTELMSFSQIHPSVDAWLPDDFVSHTVMNIDFPRFGEALMDSVESNPSPGAIPVFATKIVVDGYNQRIGPDADILELAENHCTGRISYAYLRSGGKLLNAQSLVTAIEFKSEDSANQALDWVLDGRLGVWNEWDDHRFRVIKRQRVGRSGLVMNPLTGGWRSGRWRSDIPTRREERFIAIVGKQLLYVDCEDALKQILDAAETHILESDSRNEPSHYKMLFEERIAESDAIYAFTINASQLVEVANDTMHQASVREFLAGRIQNAGLRRAIPTSDSQLRDFVESTHRFETDRLLAMFLMSDLDGAFGFDLSFTIRESEDLQSIE